MSRKKAINEVNRLIEEARRSDATRLNLDRFGLTELPESIFELKQLQDLNLNFNQLTSLPESIGNLHQLRTLKVAENHLNTLPEHIQKLNKLEELNFSGNKIKEIPNWLCDMTQLEILVIGGNDITGLPDKFSQLTNLIELWLGDGRYGQPLNHLPSCIQLLNNLRVLAAEDCRLSIIPEWLGELTKLNCISFKKNQITEIPSSLSRLRWLNELNLDANPLTQEFAAVYRQGHRAVKRYLNAKAAAQIFLNETKLILVGEGEVGKTCLLDALLGDTWKEHDTTHGIEIKKIQVDDPDSGRLITLNGWDFGGQRVYRPTHQLFFSAPAVYLVVWKPREGPQQGFVKEWIQLIKRREPTAKILVVATHGGPHQRQPDIDRQELWDFFGKDTVIDFFHVDSKPDSNGERRGIKELKLKIARVASSLPEMGRSVPKRWQDVRNELSSSKYAYLPLSEVQGICHNHQMDDEEARLFVSIEHSLGHLIHYQHDPGLRDIVVLKPNWLAIAISYVLDDEVARKAHGLVRLSHLSQLWNDPARDGSSYPLILHPIFLRLMERFDLSYRVTDPSKRNVSDPLNLIGQLVPDIRPENVDIIWPPMATGGDIQQTQICHIIDAQDGQSSPAEGLFYQLIVRLHKYSLGRMNYNDSVHWQRGLILDDDYNGRALLEYIGNDVRITVRASYPERFLAMLTAEVKFLVESFWEGLRCEVMVPCIEPCGRHLPGTGLFEVEKLINSKRKGRPEFPCPVCNEWQNIDILLRNAPIAQPISFADVMTEFASIKNKLADVDTNTKRVLSRVDKIYADLIQVLTDEAKEGPRLFSLIPVNRKIFNPKEWTSAKFQLTLWCEHSRLPLPVLNEKNIKLGVYKIELTRDWFKKAAPLLKILTGTLSLVLPVASSGIKLALDDTTFKSIEEQLDFSKEIIDASLEASEKVNEWLGQSDTTRVEHGEAINASGATLRELHALLKLKDPSFGGLIRVMNKRQEFLWVHPKFEKEY